MGVITKDIMEDNNSLEREEDVTVVAEASAVESSGAIIRNDLSMTAKEANLIQTVDEMKTYIYKHCS